MNFTVFTYYVTLMNDQTHVCLIASSVKTITKCIAVVYLSQDGFMLRLVCVFLGCDKPIQLVLSSKYDNSLEDIFIMYGFTSPTS